LTSNDDIKRVGIMVGREWSWPPAFIDEVNRRNAGVIAEFVRIGGTTMNEPCPYDVIVDRISHEIPYYRTYLKNAALQGTIVINNPFWWSADDKFFGACLADKLGIAHPKSVALPSRSYVEGVVDESLRNLEYPIPWEKHVEYVGGFPVIMKPVWGGGFKSVYRLNNYDELFRAYGETGTTAMMLQEFIDWEKYARCLCIGQDNILTIKFDPTAPWPHRYFIDHSFLTEEEGRLVNEGAIKLNRALGYDMNTVEFAIKDGVPYAIDFTNPAPDFEVTSLTEHYFDWVVNAMADLCIDLALGRRQQQPIEPRWDQLLYGATQASAAQPEAPEEPPVPPVAAPAPAVPEPEEPPVPPVAGPAPAVPELEATESDATSREAAASEQLMAEPPTPRRTRRKAQAAEGEEPKPIRSRRKKTEA
jgi:hypothetical protein